MSRRNQTFNDQEAENSSTGHSKCESLKGGRCPMCLRNRREAVHLERKSIWRHKDYGLWRAS